MLPALPATLLRHRRLRRNPGERPDAQSRRRPGQRENSPTSAALRLSGRW